MAEATIGALRVVLGMDSARFEKGLKDAEKRTNSFVKNVTTIAAGIGLERHLTNAVESFVGSFKRAVSEAERFGEMAQQFGVPVEQLSALKHSADLSGVSIETLGTSMGRLSKAVFEAADGVGPTAVAFRALGVEIKNEDGTLKSNNETILAVSEAFSKMEDGAQKTALAMAIFGRGGAALLPLLNQGAQALRDQTEEAQKFGLVISTQTAVAADRFMDTLDKIGKVWQGTVNVAIRDSLPLLQLLADRWLNISSVQDTVESRGRALAGMFNTLMTALSRVVELGLKVDAVATGFGRWMRQMGTDADQTVQQTRNRIDELSRSFEQLRAEMLLSSAPLEMWRVRLAVYGETAVKAAASTNQLSDAAKDLNRTMAEKEAQVPAGTSTLEKISSDMLDLPEKAERAKKSYSLMLEHMRGNQELGEDIRKQLASPFDELNTKMAETQFAFSTTAISAETFTARMQQLGLQMSAVWGSAFASLAGSIETAFTAIAGENKRLLAIGKIAGAAQALINAYVAASRALAEGGPLAGPVFAASILSAGLAFVAQIKAVDVGAFAQGGSFTVGGAGGVDSQRVMMSVTPGERVDVHKPSSAGNRDLVVRGIRPRDLFTGETVREMVIALNGWIKDGGTGIKLQ